jgi:hypothetical protein
MVSPGTCSPLAPMMGMLAGSHGRQWVTTDRSSGRIEQDLGAFCVLSPGLCASAFILYVRCEILHLAFQISGTMRPVRGWAAFTRFPRFSHERPRGDFEYEKCDG